MLENLLVILVLLGYVIGAMVFLATLAYVCLIAKEIIENIKMRYFPQKYYYDWDEEV